MNDFVGMLKQTRDISAGVVKMAAVLYQVLTI